MYDHRLHQSVRRHLDQGEDLSYLAHMWRRHPWFLPYAAVAFGVCVLGAALVGFEPWSTRVALGFAGAAVSSFATTEYRVLAQTDQGLVLLKSSRIRRFATDLVERLPADTTIHPVGSNLVMTDWEVGDRQFTVMRRFQADMTAMSQR